MRKPSTTLVLSCLSAAALVACATSPLGRSQLKLVSDSELNQLGATAFQETSKTTPVTTDGRTTAYVNCIANALIRQVGGSWEVKVFASNDVNAFALPGGKIGVYTGLLKVATTQDQLAAVIGHEVTHVLAGHSAERVSSNAVGQLGTAVASAYTGIDANSLSMATQTLFLLPYSRSHESEADLLGLDYMARAGFDPRAASQLWRNMAQAGGQKPPEFASSHPSDETRIRQIEARLPQDLPVFQQAQAAGKRPKCG